MSAPPEGDELCIVDVGVVERGRAHQTVVGLIAWADPRM
jgi:hypothetical protein